jgi:hypothetical protein
MQGRKLQEPSVLRSIQLEAMKLVGERGPRDALPRPLTALAQHDGTHTETECSSGGIRARGFGGRSTPAIERPRSLLSQFELERQRFRCARTIGNGIRFAGRRIRLDRLDRCAPSRARQIVGMHASTIPRADDARERNCSRAPRKQPLFGVAEFDRLLVLVVLGVIGRRFERF